VREHIGATISRQNGPADLSIDHPYLNKRVGISSNQQTLVMLAEEKAEQGEEKFKDEKGESKKAETPRMRCRRKGDRKMWGHTGGGASGQRRKRKKVLPQQERKRRKRK